MSLLCWHIRATQTIPQRKVLAIVVQKMRVMNGVVTRAIQNASAAEIHLIVDGNGPEVDKHKHANEQIPMERKHKAKQIIRNTCLNQQIIRKMKTHTRK